MLISRSACKRVTCPRKRSIDQPPAIHQTPGNLDMISATVFTSSNEIKRFSVEDFGSSDALLTLKHDNKPILPGATVGVLGSGQLGRMFAIAARRMGYRVHTFSPDTDTPTGQVADVEIQAEYSDLDAVRAFAKNVAVMTFEFENVPAPTAEAAASEAPVRPAGAVLH